MREGQRGGEAAIARREFLRGSGLVVAGAFASGALPLASAHAARAAAGWRTPDLHLLLKARRRQVPLLAGTATRTYSYVGRVKRGDRSALQRLPGSYLGPTLRVRRGQRVRVDFLNRLSEESIVHWHGLHVPADMDGHPRHAVGPGGRYRYEFDVVNRAGTYWYHPHPHGRTGAQVYRGLAGLLLVSDDEEAALGLPAGDYDLPLVIQDRRFDADNQFVYRGGFGSPGSGGMGDGELGDEILVNGQHEPVLDVEARPYRLRLLNGSNSRIYRLAWEDGEPLTVIGTDGGLLRRPVDREFVTLAPGERVEVWVDFARWPVGSELTLVSGAFDNGMFGMGGSMADGDDEQMGQGAAMEILALRVVAASGSGSPLPARLTRFRDLDPDEAVNADDPRRFEFSFSGGAWTINGRSFQMNRVSDEEKVSLGSLELWELVNVPGTGMGPGGGGGIGPMMPHPVHLHGQQFQVVERSVDPTYDRMWRDLHAGYVDGGWKDTVLLTPGERVRLLRRFDDYAGLFLYHCHNLEHEDLGMMRNLLVS